MATDALSSSEAEKIEAIINAASQHNTEGLSTLIEKSTFSDCNAVDVQDPKTKFSPLHAAIASCGNKTEAGAEFSHPQEDAAANTVQVLLENGAIWNQLDANNETPGCIAFRLGQEDLYRLMVDAGVRAEMLLNRLDGYEQLEDEDDDNETKTEDKQEGDQPVKMEAVSTNGDVTSTNYLSSTLSLTDNKLLDDQQNGVMMDWESGIMQQSTNSILFESGLKVLNIGFGMGIIDSHIQEHQKKPNSHHIIEAHPDVLASMKAKGWDQKPGVVIHEGKWQDILPQLIGEGEVFDAIYFDTFAEDYNQFRDFFSEHVIGLLSPEGRWSFFNGMGADRQISYDVYQKVVEIDLFESGFDVEWHEVELPQLDQEWEGVRRKYWNVDRYRLPVCKFME